LISHWLSTAQVVLIGESERGRHRSRRFTAHRHKIGPQRLRVAGVVIGAALQDRRLAIPAPRHDKTGKGFVMNRALQRRRIASPNIQKFLRALGHPTGRRWSAGNR